MNVLVSGAHPKKVALLIATPVNNSLGDQIAVRHTRRFGQQNYRNDEITDPDGETWTIRFPTPRPKRLETSTVTLRSPLPHLEATHIHLVAWLAVRGPGQ